jgi:hypothetical protein
MQPSTSIAGLTIQPRTVDRLPGQAFPLARSGGRRSSIERHSGSMAAAASAADAGAGSCLHPCSISRCGCWCCIPAGAQRRASVVHRAPCQALV